MPLLTIKHLKALAHREWSKRPVVLGPPPRPNRRRFPFVASVDFQGIPVDIEQRKGDTREGVDVDGTPWKVTMHAHYGEIRSSARGAKGTIGARGMDGDRLDVYLGPAGLSPLVVVVDQKIPETGKFDEQKVMLGFLSVKDALDCYRKQYTKPGFYGGHKVWPIGWFKEQIANRANAGQVLKADIPGGFVGNIERMAIRNRNFRRVLYTVKHTQLVLMSLRSGEQIGTESHPVDQFFRVESGSGEVMIAGKKHKVGDGDAIIIPAKTSHNITNTGGQDLKLYTLYAPPHHRDGVVHRTRADAEADEERFDGKTSLDKGGHGLCLVFPVPAPHWLFHAKPDTSPPHCTFLYIGQTSSPASLGPGAQSGVDVPFDTIVDIIRMCLSRLPHGKLRTTKELGFFQRPSLPEVWYLPVDVPEQALYESVRSEIVMRLRGAGVDVEDVNPLRWEPHVTWSYGAPMKMPWSRTLHFGGRLELWGGPRKVSFRPGGAKIEKALDSGELYRWHDGGYRMRLPSGDWIPVQYHDGSWYARRGGRWKPFEHLNVTHPHGPTEDTPLMRLPVERSPRLPAFRRQRMVSGYEHIPTRRSDPAKELRPQDLRRITALSDEPNDVDHLRIASKLSQHNIGYHRITSWEPGPDEAGKPEELWRHRLRAADRASGLHVHLSNLGDADVEHIKPILSAMKGIKGRVTLSHSCREPSEARDMLTSWGLEKENADKPG